MRGFEISGRFRTGKHSQDFRNGAICAFDHMRISDCSPQVDKQNDLIQTIFVQIGNDGRVCGRLLLMQPVIALSIAVLKADQVLGTESLLSGIRIDGTAIEHD